MTFLEKLDSLMKEKGLNKNTLSAGSGIPYTTIDSFYKKGYENTKLSTVQKLAEYFDTTIDYLMREEITDPDFGKTFGFSVSFPEKTMIEKYRALDPHGRQMADYVLDAEYSRVQQVIAASHGEAVENVTTIAVPLLQDAYSGKVIGSIPVPAAAKYPQEDLRAVKVKTDEMAPRISPGDTLIYKRQSEVSYGDIAIVIVGDDAFCRAVYKEGDTIKLVPLNEKYKPQIFSMDDVRKKRLQIMGRVVENIQAV